MKFIYNQLRQHEQGMCLPWEKKVLIKINSRFYLYDKTKNESFNF